MYNELLSSHYMFNGHCFFCLWLPTHWAQEWQCVGDILNSRERELVAGLDSAYFNKFHKRPTDPNLVYFLGDSLEWKSWSATSGKLPTFRRQSGLYLQRAKAKLLTPYDKLAAFGWPTSKEAAEALGVNIFPCLDLNRADSHTGNGMHLGNCGIAILVGISCFGRKAVANELP